MIRAIKTTKMFNNFTHLMSLNIHFYWTKPCFLMKWINFIIFGHKRMMYSVLLHKLEYFWPIFINHICTIKIVTHWLVCMFIFEEEYYTPCYFIIPIQFQIIPHFLLLLFIKYWSTLKAKSVIENHYFKTKIMEIGAISAAWHLHFLRLYNFIKYW